MLKKIYFLFFTLLFLLNCNDNPYQQGAYLYQAKCANCHMDDGTGLGANIPTLVNADYIAKYRNELPCIIKNGLADTISVNGVLYKEAMPPNPKLTEAEIANIINYVIHTWNSEVAELNMKEVKDNLEICQ